MFSLEKKAGEPDMGFLSNVTIVLYSVSIAESSSSVGTCLRELMDTTDRLERIDTCQVQKKIEASCSVGALLDLQENQQQAQAGSAVIALVAKWQR